MKEKKLNDYNEGILRKMYLMLIPMTILNVLLACQATLVDSFIVSRLLGARAMAALGIVSPLMSFFWVFINVISNGATVFSGRCLGRGDMDRLNGAFTMCLTLLTAGGVTLGVLLGLFHGPVARLLGATEELAPMAEAYILGLAISAAGIALSGPLNSFLLFDNQKKMTFVSMGIMVVMNVVCDVLFAKVFGMGMFGLGLASGVSYYCADLYNLSYFRKKTVPIHLDRKLICWKDLPEIIRVGLPVASMELCHFLRPVFFNRILLRCAGVLAVAAYAAEGTLASFFGSFCGGVGSLTLTVGSVIAGEEDGASLNRFAKVVYKYSLLIFVVVFALFFVFAKTLVRPFCGGDSEVLALAVRACRCLAIGLTLNVMVMITVRFYQALGYGKLVSVLNVLDYFVFPVAWGILLAPGMGADGAWFALILAEASTLAVILILTAIKLKRPKFTLQELIQFGHSFDVPGTDRLDTTLYSMEDVIGISQFVEGFCKEHGLNQRTSIFSALAIEEMAGNIVEHGFADGKKHAVDIRVLCREKEMIIRLRDDCRPFDPKQQLSAGKSDDPGKNVGIRMIAALSKDMTYQKLFSMNVTTIVLDTGAAMAK